MIKPVADNDIDLGSANNSFKDAHIQGTATIGTVTATTNFNIGSLVITDDQIQMTPSANDTVTISAAANGILNITTVGYNDMDADINLTADGQIVYRANDSAGHIFDINGTNQLAIIDGMIKPVTDNDIDLGSANNSFKDAHIQLVLPFNLGKNKFDEDKEKIECNGLSIELSKCYIRACNKYIYLHCDLEELNRTLILGKVENPFNSENNISQEI